MFTKETEVYPLEKLYSYRHSDDQIANESSSGGAFTALATMVIEDGGVVFGAAFDNNWNIHHICVDNLADLKLLRGSKYVQSRIGQTYKEAEKLLKDGIKVLFSGTPCEIRGLKLFLKREYANLLAVDFICHGVPSPGVWCKYLEEIKGDIAAHRAAAGKNTVFISLNAMPLIEGIAFREKQWYGWEKYCFVVRGKSAYRADQNSVLLCDIHNKNPYMKGFLSNLYLRPSCYSCPVKKGTSGSDIQLADFWGIKEINRKCYSPDGVSMVIAQSENGRQYSMKLKNIIEVIGEDISIINRSYAVASPMNPHRKLFFDRYASEKLVPLINEMTKDSFFQRVYVEIRILLKQVGINHIINKFIRKWRKR